MSKTVAYRDYTISSTPVSLPGTAAWMAKIEISSEREGIVSAEPYTDDATYTTEEDADIHGITLGQAIIDGKAPELSED